MDRLIHLSRSIQFKRKVHMKLFHFLSEEYALKDLWERRLKISRIEELNDPFELLAVELGDKAKRASLEKWRIRLSKKYGLLCFSRSWRNPVQWSHYAAKHKGICLGFEVSDQFPQQVSYVSSRFNWPQRLDDAFAQQLLFTKFAHWSYEEECRIFTRLKESEGGLFFFNFSPQLALKQVIVGHRGTVTRSTVAAALGDLAPSVEVFKARPAFRSFRVVRNQDESSWV